MACGHAVFQPFSFLQLHKKTALHNIFQVLLNNFLAAPLRLCCFESEKKKSRKTVIDSKSKQINLCYGHKA